MQLATSLQDDSSSLSPQPRGFQKEGSAGRKRPSRYLEPRDRNADLERWLATGRVHPQTFSPEDYQYLLDQGENPDDPSSLLHVGPSDAMAKDYWRKRREQEKLASTKRKKN